MVVLIIAWFRHGKETALTRVPLSRMDYVGSLLLLSASVLLIVGIQEAGSTVYQWSSPPIIATLTVAGFCWIALFVWQYFLPSLPVKPAIVPIFPLRLLTKRVMLAGIM
jgi:hypothetical protein